MTQVIAKSVPDAIPAILKAMRMTGEPWIEVWIPNEHIGYWAVIKQNPKPVAEMSLEELKRALRAQRNPQPYDVKLVEWDGFMYRGYHEHQQTSSF